MSNDNELPGSMVIVAQGPDDQYAYEVPPIDSAAVAGNMFGDLIQRDIYLQKNIHYPVRSIVEQGTKEKKEINKKVSDQVDGLLKQITQGKREATRQERVDVMSAVLHKMESDLEGYKKTFTKGPFIDYEKQSSLSIYEAWVKIWEKNSWEERKKYPFQQLVRDELERAVAYYKQDSLSEAVNVLRQELNKQKALKEKEDLSQLERDYRTRKANLEMKVQSELDQAGSALPPLVSPTPEQWLERATRLVTQAIADKKQLQTTNNTLIKNAPTPLEKQKAIYNGELLVDEIASLQARLDKLNAETTRRRTEAERKAAEEQALQDAVKFTADFYKEVTEKFGARTSEMARQLAEGARGKNIRSSAEAIKSFEKHKDALNKKLSLKDRQAIAKAFDSLDKQMMAKSLEKFSKGFGVVGKAIDAASLYQEFKRSTETGDWKPLFVKVETLAAGAAASWLVGIAFATATATPIGILGFALVMAVTGAMIDEGLLEKANNLVMSI